jgi:hypothetical protein
VKGVPEQRPTDVEAVAADDALLDALAAGRRPTTDDGVAVALAELRSALDASYVAAALPDEVPVVPDKRFVRRGGFVAAAAVTVAVSLTGVAAAVGGDANPIHRVVSEIVGDQNAPDPHAIRAKQLLDQAAALVAAGQARGSITSDERDQAGQLLDLAATDIGRVRDRDDQARDHRRLDGLRATLAALSVRDGETGKEPAEPTETPGAPEPGDDRSSATATPEPSDTHTDSPESRTTSGSGGDGEHSATPTPTPQETSTDSGGDRSGSD